MSSLDAEQVALESELDRDNDTEVHIKFRVSKEAMDRLVPRGATRRQFEEALTVLLACGLYTRIQDIRDLGRVDVPIVSDVPALRRYEDLQQAARAAQIGLTQVETVALWADKAVAYTR